LCPRRCQHGFIAATARIWTRAWQVSAAYICPLVICLTKIAYVSAACDNPLFAKEFKVFGS
jgi:hypothetical protein